MIEVLVLVLAFLLAIALLIGFDARQRAQERVRWDGIVDRWEARHDKLLDRFQARDLETFKASQIPYPEPEAPLGFLYDPTGLIEVEAEPDERPVA